MFIGLLSCFFALAPTQPVALYGPAEVVVPVEGQGNPYDPDLNNMEVEVQGKRGLYRRPAYYDRGTWKARILLPERGTFTGRVFYNGSATGRKITGIKCDRVEKSFVRTNGTQFVAMDGREYWPVGHNLAWRNKADRPMDDTFAEMAKNGLNWSRVWSCYWDARNPYWIENKPAPQPGYMLEEALDNWEKVMKSAEKHGIRLQFVFFHHGMFSTQVNPNWPDHPWFVKNGGFLPDAESFFTDARAKKYAKQFLRYAIARWGTSPALLSWELFNEVQFTDLARKKDGWPMVGKWHNEMASYLRAQDPYHRMITTSSELDAPIWNGMDYFQGHGYPQSISGMLMGTKPDAKRPLFFGEVGLGGPGGPDGNVHAIRDGIWGGFFAHHAGAGQFWYWDQMNPKLYAEYKRGIELLRTLGRIGSYQPLAVNVKCGTGGVLRLVPGRGWEKTERMEFDLPADGGPLSTGQLSTYLQGTANRAMQPRPLSFKFTAPKAGSFRMVVGEVSRGGADVRITLDGNEVLAKSYPATAENTPKGEVLTVPYAAGTHTIVVNNVGSDWVSVRQYELDALAPVATAIASRSGSTTVLRLGSSAPGEKVEVSPFAPGRYRLTSHDLSTGKATRSEITVRGRAATMTTQDPDVIVVLKKI